MARVGVDDQIKSAFQDLIAPELHALRGEIGVLRGEITGEIGGLRGEIGALRSEIQRLDQKIDGVDVRFGTKIDSLRAESLAMKAELVAEIRRLDARIDGLGTRDGPGATHCDRHPRAPGRARGAPVLSARGRAAR